MWDVDGNEFIDLLNNYSSLVHGHCHPAIVAAVVDQLDRGFVFPAPSSLQADLAERISERFASIERLRFTNSGTEAVMVAIRAARAFTQRDVIVKAYGGYHGSWEQVALASNPDDASAGPEVATVSRRWADAGIPDSVRNLVRMVRYNDVDDLARIMREDGERVAAIILEPVIGESGIPATAEFLQQARALATDYGALLVLDEVVTARLDFGGVQRLRQCTPDLTTLGKIIGGGLPVGAFGGRADVMSIFDPRHGGGVPHHGTFNGNPLTMAAGCASLDLLTASEIARINGLGELLGGALEELCADHDLAMSVRTVGSLVCLADATPSLLDNIHRLGLENGLYFAPRGFFNISTPMDEDVIAEVIERLRATVGDLKGIVAKGLS